MLTWMLYAVAFAALVGCAALAAERAARLLALPTRWVWAAALAVSLLAPVLLPAARDEPAEIYVEATPSSGILPLDMGEAASVEEGTSFAEAGAVPSGSVRLDALLAWLWLVGSLSVAGLLLASRLRLAVARRGWRRGRLLRARVWLSRDSGPAVIGVLRPEIVVPESVLERDRESQRLVLAHEREHIAARDPLLLAFGWLLVLLAPWNPALWWQLRRLRFAVETDCDARVLAAGPDVRRYGSLLLEVGRSVSLGMPAAAFAEPKSMLQRRIEAMTSPRSKHPFRFAAVLAGVCGLAIAAAAAVPAPEMPLKPTFASSVAPAVIASTAAEASAKVQQVLPAYSSAPLETAGTDTLKPAVEMQDVAEKPRLVNGPELQRAVIRAYPPLLRDAGVSGNAVVRLVVSERGAVRPGSVTAEHATHDAFAKAAVQVMPLAKFTPARIDGRPVPVAVNLPVQFWTRSADTLPTTALDSLRRENARLRREIEQLRQRMVAGTGTDGIDGVRNDSSLMSTMRGTRSAMERRQVQMRQQQEQMQLRRRQMQDRQSRASRLVEEALSRLSLDTAKGLDRNHYLWILVDADDRIERSGILPTEFEADDAWGTRSVERQMKATLSGVEIANVYLWRGYKADGARDLNIALITRTENR